MLAKFELDPSLAGGSIQSTALYGAGPLGNQYLLCQGSAPNYNSVANCLHLPLCATQSRPRDMIGFPYHPIPNCVTQMRSM